MPDTIPDPYPAEPAAPAAPVVLQVLPALVTGGVERGTIDIAQALVEAGWGSVVASAGGPMVRELDRAGATHVKLPLDSKNPFTIRQNVARLKAVIREHGVSLVHARSRAPAWSAYWAARELGIPFVTTFHGTYNGGWLGLKTRYNSVMAKGRPAIAISGFISKHMQDVYGIDPAEIRIIHRGVDFSRFDPAHVSPERVIQLATRWRLPDGCPVVMLPGRLTRWKGQSVLIEALAQLGRKDIRCLLVGSDQGRHAYTDELKALIKKLDLTEVVHIVGDCSDMPAAYKLTDVVVSASTDPEAFGRVIVEAQAMGRPILATGNGAAPEILENGRTGLLLPPGDPASLALALDRVLALTAAQRETMAARAIAYARANFSRERMCERTLDVYREALASAAPAGSATGSEAGAEGPAP